MKILIIDAPYYKHIAEQTRAGAMAVLEAAEASVDILEVPGVLEIPSALDFAERGRQKSTGRQYDGYVLLGCVIRGQTDHYDHVCREGIGGVQQVALKHGACVGTGIITAPSRALAEERADPARRDLGGAAARACLKMLEVRTHFGL